MPPTLTLHCLLKKACDDKAVGSKPREAKRVGFFSWELKENIAPKKENATVKIDWIPGREGFNEEQSKECGLPYKEIKSRRYADDLDFFYVLSGSCPVLTDGPPIVLYSFQKAPKNAAYKVLAADSKLGLGNIKYAAPGTKRPLSAKEKNLGAPATKSMEDCTTNPRTLADAQVLLLAKLKNIGHTVRISTYVDPGCYGHMAVHYILDVGTGENFTQKYSITLTVGTL